MTIHAIYKQGVFKPVEKVTLPEDCVVEFEPRIITSEINVQSEGMEDIYAILSQSFDGGDPEVSAKHNKHQP